MRVKRARLWRHLRQSPRIAVREFRDTILNRGQVLGFLIGVIGLWLVLQRATNEERDVLADEWARSIIAFMIAAIGWMLVCLIRAPFIAHDREKKLGTWYGNRFVFKEPFLLWTQRCKATGEIEMYRFKVPFVEPGAFMTYSLHLDPDVSRRAHWSLGGEILMGPLPGNHWRGTGGTTTTKSGEAILQLRLEPGTVSTNVTVYCRSFTLGNPDDHDGLAGNYQFPRHSEKLRSIIEE